MPPLLHHTARVVRSEHPEKSDILVKPEESRLSASLLFRGDGRCANLDGFYKGRPLFLLCGGPSLARTELHRLRRPGIVTMALNNAWSIFRPDLWVSVDPPAKFLDVGWKDPAITKMVPRSSINTKIGVKKGDKVVPSAFYVRDMPSVLYFVRNDDYRPDLFFEEDTVCWGSSPDRADALGIQNKRSVMLVALRLAHHLGFGTVHLVGCDFAMPADPASEAYAWPETRPASSREHNNALYKDLQVRFAAMQRTITERALDFRIVNCTPGSRLEAFPAADFAGCAEAASAECCKPVDTRGWY